MSRMYRLGRLQFRRRVCRRDFDQEVQPLIHLRELPRVQRNARTVGLDDGRTFDHVSGNKLLELESIGVAESAEVFPPYLSPAETGGLGGRRSPLRPRDVVISRNLGDSFNGQGREF